jgi:hypothetical protein
MVDFTAVSGWMESAPRAEESFAFREPRHRWLYTGITRAAERLTIVV